jgi:hypothetical protein
MVDSERLKEQANYSLRLHDVRKAVAAYELMHSAYARAREATVRTFCKVRTVGNQRNSRESNGRGTVCPKVSLAPKPTLQRRLASREGRITQDEYDKKAREMKERQAEIALRIEQHQQGDGEYRTTLESLISLASRAAELFERSKTEQKRELVSFVFSNLQLRGKKLDFSLRSPFDLMVNRSDYPSWLGDLDSNQD